MMFTKYIVVVDDNVGVHNTSDVLFRLCANTDPQRDSIFTKEPADVLDHATSEIASGSKLGIDATKTIARHELPWVNVQQTVATIPFQELPDQVWHFRQQAASANMVRSLRATFKNRIQ